MCHYSFLTLLKSLEYSFIIVLKDLLCDLLVTMFDILGKNIYQQTIVELEFYYVVETYFFDNNYSESFKWLAWISLNDFIDVTFKM